MKTLRPLVLIVCILAGSKISAQQSLQDLKKYIDQLKSDPTVAIPASVLKDARNEKVLIDRLVLQRSTGNDDFQSRILDLIRLVGLKSENQDVRKTVVSHFVKSIPDKNLRIGGLASSAVVQFRKRDFSDSDKDSIVSYLRMGTPNLEGLFRLAGFLEIPSAKGKISAMLAVKMSPTMKWNALLALARLGDDNATNLILEKISTSTVDDSFVYSIIPGLVYTRNKKVFFELEKIVQSDTHNCRSSHPDSRSSVLCAYRVLENVAGAIEKFPIKVDESGDMLVDNYQTALETARRWLRQNPDYKLDRNTM